MIGLVMGCVRAFSSQYFEYLFPLVFIRVDDCYVLITSLSSFWVKGYSSVVVLKGARVISSFEDHILIESSIVTSLL
jgi:hypothetical protein